jgi:predicted transcriptional regulator
MNKKPAKRGRPPIGSNRVAMTVSIKNETHSKLMKLAEENDLTRSRQVAIILEEYFKTR